MLHELAVRGDRVVADGLDRAAAKVCAPTKDVSSLADAFRLDTDENAYFGTARRHSCPLYNSPRRIKSSSSRFEAPACTTASLGGQISRRDATCSKPELIRKSVALPLREISRFERRSSPCANRRRRPAREQLSDLAVCAAHLRVVQHTGLAQFFSGTATLAA